MKIVPYNFLDDLEREVAVGIEEISITYIQPADTCSSKDDVQTLKMTTQYGSCYDKDEYDQGKEGFYINIEIPEGHWSVDSSEDIVELIEDFKERIYKNQLIKKHDTTTSTESSDSL